MTRQRTSHKTSCHVPAGVHVVMTCRPTSYSLTSPALFTRKAEEWWVGHFFLTQLQSSFFCKTKTGLKRGQPTAGHQSPCPLRQRHRSTFHCGKTFARMTRFCAAASSSRAAAAHVGRGSRVQTIPRRRRKHTRLFERYIEFCEKAIVRRRVHFLTLNLRKFKSLLCDAALHSKIVFATAIAQKR